VRTARTFTISEAARQLRLSAEWLRQGEKRGSLPLARRDRDGTPTYKRAKKSVPAAREDWVAVPVPDAGIPKEWVLAAREAIKDNVWSSSAGDRMWELTGASSGAPNAAGR
jgi:hypothetical protein